MSDSTKSDSASALDRLGSLVQQIESSLTDLANDPAPPVRETLPPASERDRLKLEVLRIIGETKEQALIPRTDPVAPLGHSFPEIERPLALAPGDAIPLLEQLCDLNLLDRTLHNRVHTCERCRQCHINFVESCPDCSSIELGIEPVLTHYACAYSGLESEFADGIHLSCPKCRQRLYQLGQDFDRPYESYACVSCARSFDEPVVTAQCLHCGHLMSAREASIVDVNSFVAKPQARRALELNRLTGVDVNAIMFDPRTQIARWDVLALECRRESYRVRRHGGALSALLLWFEDRGHVFPCLREWSSSVIADLGVQLSTTLRELDVIAPVGSGYLALLLPETDGEQVAHVDRRVREALASVVARTPTGNELELCTEARTWCDEEADAAAIQAFAAAEERR